MVRHFPQEDAAAGAGRMVAQSHLFSSTVSAFLIYDALWRFVFMGLTIGFMFRRCQQRSFVRCTILVQEFLLSLLLQNSGVFLQSHGILDR
ncbi:MAG: hypothetical protein JJU06_11900 [Ectothiorhodospiraceae bacterium]|nr:hypothetical protein [Ectothiorhodospiraceae bacterium]MCH8505925.1 hypothetical protein [Ectothiorhodospiraceae bacterium]